MLCSSTWTRRPTSRTSSTASSSTSSCLSGKFMKKWTKQRECHNFTSTDTELHRFTDKHCEQLNKALSGCCGSPTESVFPTWQTSCTCVPVNPFLVGHICWRACKLKQQIPVDAHSRRKSIWFTYLQQPGRRKVLWDMQLIFLKYSPVCLNWMPLCYDNTLQSH